MRIPEDVRKDIPLTEEVIYFDNTATSLTPRPVIEAMDEYYLKYRANVHRGIHRLSQMATHKYEESRKVVADFLNAEFEEATIAGVRGLTMSEGVHHGIADAPGGGEVGFAHAEADDIVHAGDEIEELADARGGQIAGTAGDTVIVAAGSHGETASLLISRSPPTRKPSSL